MGILYKINEDYNVFTSIHKGFLLQGKRWEDAESSINSELGFRFRKNAFTVNWLGIIIIFSNLQGTDNMSGGGTGTGICSMQVQQLLKELNFRRLMTY
jgi:Fe(3+) dicitrate transport protein